MKLQDFLAEHIRAPFIEKVKKELACPMCMPIVIGDPEERKYFQVINKRNVPFKYSINWFKENATPEQLAYWEASKEHMFNGMLFPDMLLSAQQYGQLLTDFGKEDILAQYAAAGDGCDTFIEVEVSPSVTLIVKISKYTY